MSELSSSEVLWGPREDPDDWAPFVNLARAMVYVLRQIQQHAISDGVLAAPIGRDGIARHAGLLDRIQTDLDVCYWLHPAHVELPPGPRTLISAIGSKFDHEIDWASVGTLIADAGRWADEVDVVIQRLPELEAAEGWEAPRRSASKAIQAMPGPDEG